MFWYMLYIDKQFKKKKKIPALDDLIWDLEFILILKMGVILV